MKICLVNPKFTDTESIYIPQGILSICATVKNAGYHCDIVDYNLNSTNTNYDDLSRYDVIGLSVFTSQVPHALEITEKIRGKTRIVWGGIHCILDPQSILNKFKDDFVISGEGELPFLKLVKAFDNNTSLDGIEGLCYVKNGEPKIAPPYFMSDINAIADINYYDLPMLEKYVEKYNYYFSKKMKFLGIVTGRGCPWNCSFCINSVFRKHKAYHRAKDIAKIRREIEPVIDAFGIEEVLLRDDDFFSNRELVKDWAEFAKGKNILWSANARYNYIKDNMLNAEELKKFSESGLFVLGMSIEAGDEDVRNKVINKRLTNNEIINAVDIIKKSGANFVVNTSFVVYFPGDTLVSRIETIKWMDYLSRNLNIYFSGPQVYRSYPGSKLYDMEQEHVQGDLSYYINQLNQDGSYSFGASEDKDRMLFFSEVIRIFFNTRLRQLELTGNGISTMNKHKVGRLASGVLHCLFFPVMLRLRYNFWGFFIEPGLLGKISRYGISAYKFIGKIRSLFTK